MTISLVQASCAHYERCKRGECTGFMQCAACPSAQMLKRHEPPATDLGAGWALQNALTGAVAGRYPGSPVTPNGSAE